MNLEQWLEHILSLHHQAIDFSTTEARLGPCKKKHPQWFKFSCPVVTVAGTNGKGSCCKLLEHIYTAHGYQVGCYTSPDLLKFNERLTIGGQMLTDAAWISAFAQLKAELQGASCTFFEYITLAACILLNQQPLDLIILEIGMGGRLDIVNQIDHDISVLTHVAMDHSEYLGETRQAIAAEKVAIARQGRPFVYGDQEMLPAVASVFSDYGAHLISRSHPKHRLTGTTAHTWDYQGEHYHTEVMLKHYPEPSLFAALVVIDLLYPKLPVPELATAYQHFQLPGRMQHKQYQGVNFWFDVAHNEDAVTRLLEQLAQVSCEPWCVIFAIKQAKNWHDVIEKLYPITRKWYILKYDSDHPGGMVPAATLTAKLRQDGQQVIEIDVNDLPQSIAAEGGPILVTGSFVTVRDVLQILE